jgi:predicted AlkP superfamily phosphohydrolase/phosphomutase
VPSLALFVLLLPVSADARVWLVGVDGAAWSVIDPLLEQGRLPNLAALIARGVSADLETVEPVISPTVWTSIATGRAPRDHGVTNFLKNATDIRVPTLFERLATRGLRVGTYDYLLTWPPQSLPGGFVIPGWLRRDATTTPPEVLGAGYRYDLQGVNGRAATAANVRKELSAKAPQWLALADRFDLDVGAVTFYSVDGVSHRFWADSFPEQFDPGDVPPPEPAYEHIVQDTVVGVDAALGRLVAALEPDDSLIVVSDHGFEAGDEVRRIWSGRWEGPLAAAGLSPATEPFTLVSQFAYVVVRVHAGEFAARDALLDRLVAFFGSARDATGRPLYAVEILDEAERPAGHERPFMQRVRQWGLRWILDLAFGVEFDPDAHAYVILRPDHEVLEAAWPDQTITVAGRSLPISKVVAADGFTGNHHPTAVFVAAGGPIRAMAGRGTLSVLDVAPLVLWLAGSPIPDDLPGVLATHWIEPEALAARPPEIVPAASFERLPPPALPEIGDEALIERLRAMGYVE